MTLAYDARRSTRDIDAVFQPHGAVLVDQRVEQEPQALRLDEARGRDPGYPRRLLPADQRGELAR